MVDKTEVKEKVGDLTVAELKALIVQTVRESLKQLVDPDALLEPPLSEEVKEQLRAYRQGETKLLSVDEVVKNLGLDLDDDE